MRNCRRTCVTWSGNSPPKWAEFPPGVAVGGTGLVEADNPWGIDLPFRQQRIAKAASIAWRLC